MNCYLTGRGKQAHRQPQNPTPFFFFYQEQGRSKSGWMFLPDIFPGISDKPKFFVPSFPQTTVPANPFCKKAMSQGTADGVDWYQCEHDYQCPKPILSAL